MIEGIYTKGQRSRAEDSSPQGREGRRQEEGHAEDKGLQLNRDSDKKKKGGVLYPYRKHRSFSEVFRKQQAGHRDGAGFPNQGVAYEVKSKIHWQVLSHGSKSCKYL